MKIGIIGSRSLQDRSKDVSNAILNSPWLPPASNDVIVTGGADGVDSRAQFEAHVWDVDTKIIEPDYNDWSNGHPALARNTEIVEESDVLIAIWDGSSNGTKDTIDKALDAGLTVYVEQL